MPKLASLDQALFDPQMSEDVVVEDDGVEKHLLVKWNALFDTIRSKGRIDQISDFDFYK